jgi:hypothetical protein
MPGIDFLTRLYALKVYIEHVESDANAFHGNSGTLVYQLNNNNPPLTTEVARQSLCNFMESWYNLKTKIAPIETSLVSLIGLGQYGTAVAAAAAEAAAAEAAAATAAAAGSGYVFIF